MGGMTLLIISGVPRSRTCIPEEGEGTHDWAAVPADHVHVRRHCRWWSSTSGPP